MENESISPVYRYYDTGKYWQDFPMCRITMLFLHLLTLTFMFGLVSIQVVFDTPYSPDLDFIDGINCSYCGHGDDISPGAVSIHLLYAIILTFEREGGYHGFVQRCSYVLVCTGRLHDAEDALLKWTYLLRIPRAYACIKVCVLF